MAKELLLGRVFAVDPDDLPEWYKTFPIFAVPKASAEVDADGTPIAAYRVVNNLSADDGDGSLNDGIDKPDFSMVYATVADAMYAAVSFHARFGNSGRITKIDWSSAFRRLASHPDDYYLNCFVVDGVTYADAAICFGCRSSPWAFGQVAALCQWIYERRLAEVVPVDKFFLRHLLDDQLFMCADRATSVVASRVLLETAALLGIPLSDPTKQLYDVHEGPFLGVNIDLVSMRVGLPEDKEIDFVARMRALARATNILVGSLRTIVGKLVWFACIVPASKPFIATLFELQRRVQHRKPREFVRISRSVAAAAAGWLHFYESFPTQDIFVDRHHLNPRAGDRGRRLWNFVNGRVWRVCP